MDVFREIVSGPLFYQLLVYVLYLAINLLQLNEVSILLRLRHHSILVKDHIMLGYYLILYRTSKKSHLL